MSRVYNFSPGPCALPDAVMRRAQEEFCEYGQIGASIMEISHRSDTFLSVHRRAESLLRELLAVPETHAVLFLAGGATMQAAAVPLNLLGEKTTAAYLISGHWSARAEQEARRYCRTRIVGSSESTGYDRLPEGMEIPADCAFLHYAANETVHGVEFSSPPASTVPLVADMSSNILSRAVRVADFGGIYAGAQKNIGPAGVTVVVVRRDLIRPHPLVPSVVSYEEQLARESMYNTPPTFQIYMMCLVLEWVKEQGGVDEMERRSLEKAACLYDYLDSTGFYRTRTVKLARSRMNVPFFLADENLTGAFLDEADRQGLIGLKGHKVLGGCRASLYNAMPLEGVQGLVGLLRDFERRYG